MAQQDRREQLGLALQQLGANARGLWEKTQEGFTLAIDTSVKGIMLSAAHPASFLLEAHDSVGNLKNRMHLDEYSWQMFLQLTAAQLLRKAHGPAVEALAKAATMQHPNRRLWSPKADPFVQAAGMGLHKVSEVIAEVFEDRLPDMIDKDQMLSEAEKAKYKSRVEPLRTAAEGLVSASLGTLNGIVKAEDWRALRGVLLSHPRAVDTIVTQYNSIPQAN